MAESKPQSRFEGARSTQSVPGDPSRTKQSLGAYGEEVAARLLDASGLEILDRNWRCAEGELDVVARDGVALVVCEVKTRSGSGFGSPLDAVTPAKAVRLRRLARCWLGEQRTWFDEIRFDAVSVLCSHGGDVSVEHVRGVC